MDALGSTASDVLGYSWGGGLAQELARRAPDRVRAARAVRDRRRASAASRRSRWPR